MNAAAPRDSRSAILAALPVALLAFDAQDGLVLANPALLALAGATAEELPVGLSRPAVLARLGALAAEDLTWHEAPLPDGGRVLALVEASPAGRTAAAGQEAADMRLVLDRLGCGVALFGGDARLRLANPAYAPLLGLSRDDIPPGIALGDIIEAQIARGEFAPAEVEPLRQHIRAGAWRRNLHRERQRPTDETIRITNRFLPDGGWVSEVTDITAERRAEQEARRRVALQDALFEALPVGVAVYGPDRVLRHVNPAYNAILDDAVPARVGEHLQDILMRRALAGEFGPGDPAAEVAQRVARVSSPVRFERVRGSRVTVHRSVPLPDGGHAMVVADVSELTAAQAELRAREELLSATLEATQHGIAMFDAEGRVVIANRLAAHYCGIPAERFVRGVQIQELRRLQLEAGVFDPRAPANADLAARLPQVPDGADRYRYQRADGMVVEVITDRLPGGGVVRSYSDVTALVRAEAEASARAETLQTVLDSMRHGVMLVDGQGNLRLANALCGRLLGVPVEMLRPGVPFTALRDAQVARGEFGSPERTAAFLASRAARSLPESSTYVRERPDGTVIEVRTEPIAGGGCVRSYTDVTALTAAQADAAARNAMMQAMLDNMRHGIALFGPDQRLLVANSLCAQYNGVEGWLRPGVSRAEMAAEQARRGEFGPPEAAQDMLQALAARDYGQPQAWMRRRPDGTELEIRSNPVPGGGFVLTLTDVTDRVRAEQELQRRAEVLAATLNASRHSITLFDAEGRVVACNEMAAEMSGFAHAQMMIGLSHHEVVAQARRHIGGPGHLPPELNYARMDRSRPTRYQRETNDGRTLDVSSDPVPGGGYVVTIADITPLVRAEQAAQQRATVLASALNASRHALTLFDRDGRVVAANRLAAELVGVTSEAEMLGLTLEEMVRRQARHEHPGDDEAQARFVAEVLRRDRTRSLRTQRRHPDGRVLDVQSEPAADGGFAVSVADVTALVQAQEEAQRRAGVLQAMLENSRHGVVLYDRDHRLVAANALAGELMGVPDLLRRPGTPHAEILAAQRARGMYRDSEGGHRTERHFRELDRSRPQRMQRTLPDGRRFDIASDPTPDGGFVISVADVTALARAEAEAERRAGVLQTMLDNISLGILLYDKDRRLIALNDLAAEALGVPGLADMRGRPMEEILARQLVAGNFGEGEAAERLYRDLLVQDRSRPQWHQRVTRDGRVLNNASHPTPDGGYVVSIADVTPLAKAQAEAARRAEILGVMLDNIRHGIALFDACRALVASNPRLCEMVGLPPEVLVPGARLETIVAEMHARGEFGPGEEGAALAAETLARPRDRHARFIRRRPGGIVVEIVSDPTPDGGFVLTYTDVTEDRQIREALEQARMAAEAASLAKSRFLATMSHELRTPLNAVIGFSEVLSGDAPPEQTREFATAIHEAGRHLLALIDDVLDVTRADSGHLPVQLGRVDPGAMAEGVERMMGDTAERARLTLATEIAPGLPPLRADERRLRQVLLNLVTNAVKFTPAEGRITLAVRRDDQGLVFEVRDTGIGIAATDLPRVFEPFTQLDSQLDRRYPGAGLGLYLCRVLTEAQGARLTLDSTPGQGTRALVRFPPASLLTDA